MGARMNERCTTRMELMSGINIESSSAAERDGRALFLSLSSTVVSLSLSVFLCSFLSAPSVGPGPCTLASSPRCSLVQLVVHALRDRKPQKWRDEHLKIDFPHV